MMVTSKCSDVAVEIRVCARRGKHFDSLDVANGFDQAEPSTTSIIVIANRNPPSDAGDRVNVRTLHAANSAGKNIPVLRLPPCGFLNSNMQRLELKLIELAF